MIEHLRIYKQGPLLYKSAHCQVHLSYMRWTHPSTWNVFLLKADYINPHSLFLQTRLQHSSSSCCNAICTSGTHLPGIPVKIRSSDMIWARVVKYVQDALVMHLLCIKCIGTLDIL